jgi:hypothetical protein
MRRREVLTLIAGAGAWPLAARAQQTTKVARIGYLTPNSPDAPLARRNLDAFRQGLQDLGYIEGQNIAIEYRLLTASLTGCPASPPSWSGSRWTSSSPDRRRRRSQRKTPPRRSPSSYKCPRSG